MNVPFIERLEGRMLLSAGQLDSTFGVGGVVRINGTENLEIQTQASAKQSDGKLLLGGVSTPNYENDNFIDIARLTAAGQLDTSFGTNGQAELGTQDTDYTLKSLGLTSDGGILVGAAIAAQGGHPASFQITRLLANGTVDTTFGTGGSFVFSLRSGSINAMTTDASGDIYLAGTDGISRGSFTITRLTSAGLLDNTFGKYGHAVVSFNVAGHGRKKPLAATANALAVAPDGSIIVAGGGGGVGEAIRLTSNGQLDTGFATAGRLVVPAASDGFYALAFAWRGSIVFAGSNGTPIAADRSDLSATLVDHNGALIPSFGNDGTALTFVPSDKRQPTYLSIANIAVFPNRQILISGAAIGAFANGILLTRINPNGIPDANFGQAGVAVYPVAPATDRLLSAQNNVLNAAGLFIQSNGDAIVPFAGSASTTPSATADLRAIAFSTAGSLDTTFGNNGIADVLTTAEAGNTFTAISAESDGDILAVGADANQSFINDYDTNGNAIGLFNSEAARVARAPDGDLLIAEGNTLTRYHADGTIDSAFGIDGTVSFPFSESESSVSSINFLPDGSAVVEANLIGDFSANKSIDVLNDVGATTASISVSVSFVPYNTGTFISGYTITPSNKILVQYTDFDGPTGAYYDGTMRLAQYNEDLTPDTSSNTINTANGPYIAGADASVAIAPNGDIYIGNITGLAFSQLIARYTSTGVLDTTFGSGGIEPAINATGQLFIQSDGKLLFASGYDGTIYLYRYNADGTVDNTFGTNGSSTLALYPTPTNLAYEAPQILFTLTEVNGQPKLIAAGSFTLPSQPSDAAMGGGSEGFLARIDL